MRTQSSEIAMRWNLNIFIVRPFLLHCVAHIGHLITHVNDFGT